MLSKISVHQRYEVCVYQRAILRVREISGPYLPRRFVTVSVHDLLCLPFPFADEDVHHLFASLRGVADRLGDSLKYPVGKLLRAWRLPAMLHLQIYGLSPEVLCEAHKLFPGGINAIESKHLDEQIIPAKFHSLPALSEYDEAKCAAGKSIA